MPTSTYGKDTEKTVGDTPLTLYDSGGADGNAVASKTGKIVFKPEQAGKCIEIEIQQLDLANKDELYILRGSVSFSSWSSPNERYIIRKFTAGDSPTLPITLRSDVKSGEITIGSKTKATPGAGFKITVRCVDQPAITVTSITEDKSLSHDPYIGEQALIISQLQIQTEGLTKAPKLTALQYKLDETTPSDIKTIYLYEANDRKPMQLDADKLLASTTDIAATGTLALTKEYTLTEPTHSLILVIDLKEDVAAGHRINLITTQLTTTLGDHDVTLTTAKPLTVEDAYALSKTPKTYTIGDKPLKLYDDGGQYGDISEKFDGHATFKPQTAGKVIRADFTKLDLFKLSSINRADFVEVYNGSEVNADQLLIRLNEEKSYVVHSTAADGSLTIRVVSNTGMPKSGFEALISQVDPQPMRVDTLVGQIIEVDTFAQPVNAGLKKLGVMSFAVTASGTQPAATLQGLTLSSSSLASDVEQVVLYYSPMVDNFDKAKEIARWDFAQALTATLPTAQELREGTNYFYLAVDLKETAHRGNKINLSIDKILLSTGEQTLPEKERTRPEALEVINKLVLTKGQQHVKVYEPWEFMPELKHHLTTSYNNDAGERKVTFEATTPDHVVQMDINAWDFYYSSYSFGTKPTLKVYDGQDATAPLLFELKPNKEAFKNKPADYLRSTQKYLTVIFDAKGYESSLGWRAQVREYLPQDMKVDSASAKQIDLPFIAVGSKQNPVIALDIQTIGDRKPLHIDGLFIDLKGGAAQIERIALYGTDAAGALDTTRLIASTEVEPTAQRVELPTDSLQKYGELREFANNYILTLDIRKDAPEADSIDIAIAQLSLSGQTIAVKNADPEGSYPLVNLFNHPASGDNKEVTVVTPLSYYDEGGPNGDTKENAGSYVTFLPARPGEVVVLTLDSIKIAYRSEFGIYSGRDHKVASKRLFDGDSNTLKQTGVKTFASQEPDGSLTVYYKGKSIRDYGWAARVESVKPRNLFAEKAVAEALPTDEKGLLAGGAYPALRIDLTTAGEQSYTTLEKLQLEISGEGINKLYLYSTGAIDEYDEAQLLATVEPLETQTSVVLKLETPDTLHLPRTQYYWVKAQLSSEVKAGTPITLTAKSLTIAGEKIEISQEQPFSSKVRDGGLKGTLRVGASSAASYKSVAAVAKELTKQGVSGSVVVEIEPGEYTETVLLNNVPGASAQNSITLVGLGATRDEVVISATGYSKPTGDNAYRNFYGVMTVRNTPYVTLRNMTIHSTDVAFPTMVYVQENSSGFVMDNCHVYTKNTSSNNYNMSPHLVKIEAASRPHAQSCDVTVENSLFERGHVALQLGGTGTVANPVGKGYTVRNNRFVDHSGKAIYVTRASEVLIEGNEIILQEKPQRGFEGIDATFHTDAKIIGNNFNLTAAPSSKNIELLGISVREVIGKGLLVANNVIRINGGSSSSRAFKIARQAQDLDFAFNTAIAREGKSVALLMINDEIASARVTDNILQNLDGGGIFFSNKKLPNERITFDRNALYTSDSKGVLITAKGKQYDSTNYQEVTKSTASKVVKVDFVSDDVLYPKDMTVLPLGAPHATITTDILGAPRSAEHPTVGAYEQDLNVTDEAPKALKKEVVRALHQSATISIEPDQMTDVYLLAVAQTDGTSVAPEAAEIRDKGMHFTALGKRITEFTIIGLEPETTYDVYGILHGTLNSKATEPQLLYTFTTSYMPTQVATFEKDNRTLRGDTILSGTNSFLGVKVVDDFTRSHNQIAESQGDKVTITVTNSKGKIPQRGFSLMADRTVYMRIDGGTQISIPATDQDWAYVDLAKRGDIRQVTLESRGKLWIDDYNGEALAMGLYISPVTISLGEHAQLTAEVRRGVAPYTYEWSQGDSTQTISVTPTQTTRYSVTVTDAAGSKVTSTAYVYVNGLHGEVMTATFEEEQLPSEQPYNQKQSFGSGSFAFSNGYNPQYDSWNGFALAASTDTLYTGDLKQQYNNVVGGGQALEGKSAQYAVAYCPGDYPEWGMYNPTVTVMPDNDRTVQLDGIYLTNTAWVKSFATEGDKNFNRPAFEEGSFFIVVITADNGKKVEVPLIDYREKKREIVNEWKWVDLSSLGAVKMLTFSILSSDSYAPSYFALDNLHIKQDASAQKKLEQIAVEVVETTEATAQIRWQALPTQVSYAVSYRPAGSDATETLLVDPTQQLRGLELRDGYIYTTLEGLQIGTRYEVTVEATIMPAMQVVAEGKKSFTTTAIEGKLDAQLVQESLQAQSFALSFATIAQAESYMIQIAKVDKSGTTLGGDVIKLKADGSPLGELSPLQGSSKLQDGRITLTLQSLTEQTAYRVIVSARRAQTVLCSEQLIVVTPQSTALTAIDGEEVRVVATPEGILVSGLQGATIELYTATGAQVGHYQITEPTQLIAEQLQSGIYILAAYREGEVQTFRLIL